jgi:small-conductance mechanosensitive channel
MNEISNVINNSISITFKEVLEYKIFSLSKYSLTVYELAGALIILMVGLVVSKVIRRLIYKSERFDLGKKFAFSQVFHYVIVIIIFFLVMKILGVDISPLLVGSSVILVGIGLGLQNLFLDFISGIIILLDRTIQVGDVVDIDGVIGEVQEIKMRTTTILTRDNKSIIFPNSVLTKNRLVNFSHNDEVVAFEITVGVHYDTDLELLEKLMLEAALENESVLKEPAPSVRLENFGDSSLDFKMFYNTKNLFRQPTMRSNIRKSILRKFRENGINIPYPIRTLEFPKNTFQ